MNRQPPSTPAKESADHFQTVLAAPDEEHDFSRKALRLDHEERIYSAPPKPSILGKDKLPRISSEQIFQGASTLEIDHGGQRYLLRVTRENKLILTK